MRTRELDEPWVENPPADLPSIVSILEAWGQFIREESKRGQTLRRLLKLAKSSYDTTVQEVRTQYPIAYFKPSYEQALMLNAWVWGITFPICFSANRIGKTVCMAVNAILNIFPNNPQWKMFQPYIDKFGRLVCVLQRPNWDSLLNYQKFLLDNSHLVGDFYKQPYESTNLNLFKTLQNQFATLQMLPAFPKPPIQRGGIIWLGAPDHDWHRHIMMRRWKELLPQKSILKFNTTDCFFSITTGQTAFDIDCKSYDSESTKWSGDAVTGIILTEGFTQEIFDEVKQRIINNGFMSWDYTPAEPRNVGKKVRIAYKVVTGEEQLPLRSFVFQRFSVRHTPDHILPKEKREDMIRIWKDRPEEAARIDGDFYASSGLVLDKLDSEFHCLDWTLEELFARYPDGRFYRGIDPGLDHPTTCCWGYLSYNNIWFIYRFYSERGKTISERCQDIIRLSNNSRQKWSSKNGQIFWRETHPNSNSEVFTASPTDYHIFKKDENTNLIYANHYFNEGLSIVESTHMGPEERAQNCNRLLDRGAFPYLSHPRTEIPPGARIFFLHKQPGVSKALEKMKELFWDRYKRGDLAGEPKDRVPEHGDDELDALCNLTCGPYVWTQSTPRRIEPKESEPEIRSAAPPTRAKEKILNPVGFY